MSIGYIVIVSVVTIGVILGISIPLSIKVVKWSKSRDLDVTITRVEDDGNSWLMYYEHNGNEYCVEALKSGDVVPEVGETITVYFYNGTTYMK